MVLAGANGKVEMKCQYKGCRKKATHLAYGRKSLFGTESHPKVGCYCEKHALEVAHKGTPECVEVCPNCGCMFGRGC